MKGKPTMKGRKTLFKMPKGCLKREKVKNLTLHTQNFGTPKDVGWISDINSAS